jgi:hypothetical protein
VYMEGEELTEEGNHGWQGYNLRDTTRARTMTDVEVPTFYFPSMVQTTTRPNRSEASRAVKSERHGEPDKERETRDPRD